MDAQVYSSFSREMKKTAVIGLPLGILGHFSTNLAGRAAHHGSNLAEVMAHRGFQHGATDSNISRGASRALRALLGPESLIQYDAARAAGASIYKLPPDKRKAALQALSSGVEEAAGRGHLAANAGEIMSKAPVFGPLQQAARHELAGSAPELQAHGVLARTYSKAVDLMSRLKSTPFQTPLQRTVTNVVGAAPAAALVAADPLGAVTHIGWNTARELAGHTAPGKAYVKNQMTKGMKGIKPSRLEELVMDIGASPAFLDPQRIGNALREAGAVDPMQRAIAAADKPETLALLRGMATPKVPAQHPLGRMASDLAGKVPDILAEAKKIVPTRMAGSIVG